MESTIIFRTKLPQDSKSSKDMLTQPEQKETKCEIDCQLEAGKKEISELTEKYGDNRKTKVVARAIGDFSME